MIKGELRPRDTKLVKVTAKSVKEQRPELDLKPVLISSQTLYFKRVR